MKKLIAILFALPLLHIAINLYDPALNPQIQKIIDENPQPAANENGYFVFLGMDAPGGEDAHAYGLAKTTRNSDNDAIATAGDETVYQDFNILKKWNAPENAGAASPTTGDIKKLLDQYALVQSRAFSMEKYPSFYEGSNATRTPPYNIVQLQDLAIADMIYKARTGQGDKAINRWLTNANFIQKSMNEPHTTSFHALLELCRIKSLNALDAILKENASLAKTYQTEITRALSIPSDGSSALDIHKIFLGQYSLLKTLNKSLPEPKNIREKFNMKFFYKRNATYNALFSYYDDLKKITLLPADQKEQSIKTLIEEHNLGGISPFIMLYNPVGNLLVGPLMIGTNLFLETHPKNLSKMQAQNMKIKALAEQTP